MPKKPTELEMEELSDKLDVLSTDMLDAIEDAEKILEDEDVKRLHLAQSMVADALVLVDTMLEEFDAEKK